MSEHPESSPEEEAIWGLQDYAVFVPMSDKFYKTLKFAKINKAQFDSGEYEPQAPYADSRTYLTPLIKALTEKGGVPFLLDVGGYIGRFSIETALALKALGMQARIHCFEPGDTAGLLQQNIALNKLDDYIDLQRYAVSNKTASVEFAIAADAKITSRIVPDGFETKKQYGDRWSQSTVQSISLSDYMSSASSSDEQPFICKIDTEGHEVQVIQGIGQKRLETVPNALIVEYRPALGNQQLFGQPFEQFVLEHYSVFNIRNSLYPTDFEHHGDFQALRDKFDGTNLDNLDLLLVHKSIASPSNLLQLFSR